MADSTYEYVEIRFDVRDPQQTHCYVYIETRGDSPHMIQGWHHKAYPATMSTRDIHNVLCSDKEHDPIYWPRLAPPDVKLSEAGQLAHAILTWEMGMDPTNPGWAYWEGLRMLAETVIGERTSIVHDTLN
jgi:hypothetical protein